MYRATELLGTKCSKVRQHPRNLWKSELEGLIVMNGEESLKGAVDRNLSDLERIAQMYALKGFHKEAEEIKSTIASIRDLREKEDLQDLYDEEQYFQSKKSG
jgi:hypothetical protein